MKKQMKNWIDFLHVLAYHYIQGLPWQIENENKYFVKMDPNVSYENYQGFFI